MAVPVEVLTILAAYAAQIENAIANQSANPESLVELYEAVQLIRGEIGGGGGSGGGGATGGEVQAAIQAATNLASVSTNLATVVTQTDGLKTVMGTVGSTASATGTLTQQLRTAAEASASIQAAVGGVGSTSSATGALTQQLRYLADSVGAINATASTTGAITQQLRSAAEGIGAPGATSSSTGALTAQLRLLLDSLGAVGAGADVDGVLLGQLRAIATGICDPQAVVAHSTITAVQGLNPTSSNAQWISNTAKWGDIRFYASLALRGNTSFTDDPVVTLRPYARNGTTVSGGEAIAFRRPRLSRSASQIRVFKTINSGSSYTDYSTQVNDGLDTTGADLGALDTIANGDWLVIGCPFSTFSGIGFDLDATNVNANTATATYSYWNGSAWTSLANVTDGTLTSGRTFGVDGLVTWSMPTDWASSTINSVTAFYVRASVSAALSATVEVEAVDLVFPINQGLDFLASGDDALCLVESVTGATGAVAIAGSISYSWR